jgi:hypothetical protein
MTQNEQPNLTADQKPLTQLDKAEAQLNREKKKSRRREWLPEDDDDWYEPDYERTERRQ